MLKRSFCLLMLSALSATIMMQLTLAAKPVLSADSKLQQRLKAVKSIKANFSQRVIDADNALLDESSGRFYLSRPGKFKWDYAGDGPKIVSDGKKIYFHSPDLEQVIVRRLQNAINQVPSLVLVATDTNLSALFVVDDLPASAGLDWFSLRPKADDAAYQEMRLGFDADQLSAISILDGLGQTTQLQLSAVKTTAVASSEFAFRIPKGADVINDF